MPLAGRGVDHVTDHLLDANGHWDWAKIMGLFQGIVDYLAPLL